MEGRCHHLGETTSDRRYRPIERIGATMSAKIIVSYDGTANEDDAIALGRVLARAGGEVSLAYVRHTHEPDRDRETLAQNEAQELLERGASLLGIDEAPLHVVTDRSTPEGLRALAQAQG